MHKNYYLSFVNIIQNLDKYIQKIKKSQKRQKNFINVLTFMKKYCNINKHCDFTKHMGH